MTIKVDENRLRRAAERQGYMLVKSRRRDPRARDYGQYWLRAMATGELVTQRGMSLNEIEMALAGATPEVWARLVQQLASPFVLRALDLALATTFDAPVPGPFYDSPDAKAEAQETHRTILTMLASPTFT